VMLSLNTQSSRKCSPLMWGNDIIDF